MRYLSLCSGIEAATVAWHPLGWTPVAFAQFDPEHNYKNGPDFPSAVLAHHYPAVPNLGDMTKIDGAAYQGKVDLLVAGTPCFAGGTLILSTRGLLPIEEIREGDLVLTHKGRWRRVMATMSREADTIVLKGQGHPGLVTTPEHPFWSVGKSGRVTRIKGKSVRLTSVSDPDWTDAKDMNGRFWSTPATVPSLPVPPFVSRHTNERMPEMSAALMWLLGAWLGDGWLRTGMRGKKTAGSVMLCGNKKDAAYLAQKIADAGLSASKSFERTTVRFTINNMILCRWVQENFGEYCDGKTVPAWLLGASTEFRMAFLAGYFFADGHSCTDPVTLWPFYRITTINFALVVGLRMLAASLGWTTSVMRCVPNRREPLRIEGREVTERPFYQTTMYPKARSAFFAHDKVWGKVRSVEPTGRRETVYNFEVEEDNSYVADGIVVHNCQAFSVAGLRKGLDDARGNLTLTYVQLVKEIDPKYSIWENVPGVLSDKTNAFGCLLAGLCGASDPLVPPGAKPGKPGKWPDAGVVAGPERWAAWRIIDAQGFDPQRRRRVFVVSTRAADRFDPGRVLFEAEADLERYLGDRASTGPLFPVRQSLRGDSASGRETGKSVAGSLAAGPGSSYGISPDCFDRSGEGANATAAERSGLRLDRELAYALRAKRAGGVVDLRERDAGGVVAFGGNNTAGPIQVSTAINAHGGPHGRLDFESETFVLSSEFGRYDTGDAAAAVRAKGGDVGGGSEVLVCHGTMDPCSQKELAFALGRNIGGENVVHCPDVAPCLTGNYGKQPDSSDTAKCPMLLTFSGKDHGADATKDVAPIMRAMGHSGSHANAGGQLAVCIHSDAIARTGDSLTSGPDAEGRVRKRPAGKGFITDGTVYNLTAGSQPHAVCITGDVTHTLRAEGFDASEDATGRGTPIVTSCTPLRASGAANANGAGIGRDGDPSLTLDCDGSAAVAFQASQSGMRLGDGTHPTLDSNNGSRRHHGALIGSAVRRLTPGECESLQNFPRGYTAIPWKKHGSDDCPDGPRYRALGNSMNCGVMAWLGRRIEALELETALDDLLGNIGATEVP